MAQRVATALELRIRESAAEDGCERPLTPFDSASVPPVSMSFYLERLANYCRCGEECFIVALYYVDMVTQGKALTPLSERNVHRLFLTCLLVAHKFWDDCLPWNSHYAKCGGISLQELNRLEKLFLKTVGFKLHVSRHTYAAYETAVTAIERTNKRIADGALQTQDSEASGHMPALQQTFASLRVGSGTEPSAQVQSTQTSQRTLEPSLQVPVKPFHPSTPVRETKTGEVSSRILNPTRQEPAQKRACLTRSQQSPAVETVAPIQERVTPSETSNQMVITCGLTDKTGLGKVRWVVKLEDGHAPAHTQKAKGRRLRHREVACPRFSQRKCM